MKHPRSRGQVFGNACAFLEFGPSLKAASQRLLSEARRNRAQFGLDRHRPSWTGASSRAAHNFEGSLSFIYLISRAFFPWFAPKCGKFAPHRRNVEFRALCPTAVERDVFHLPRFRRSVRSAGALVSLFPGRVPAPCAPLAHFLNWVREHMFGPVRTLDRPRHQQRQRSGPRFPPGCACLRRRRSAPRQDTSRITACAPQQHHNRYGRRSSDNGRRPCWSGWASAFLLPAGHRRHGPPPKITSQFQLHKCSQFYSDWRASKIKDLIVTALPRDDSDRGLGRPWAEFASDHRVNRNCYRAPLSEPANSNNVIIKRSLAIDEPLGSMQRREIGLECRLVGEPGVEPQVWSTDMKPIRTPSRLGSAAMVRSVSDEALNKRS